MRDNLPRRGILAQRLKDGQPRAVEEAIQFLNDDSYSHGSGYVKEECWHAISDAPLSVRQRERLQHAALKYLDRRISREFWYMCRAMAQLAEGSFREAVDQFIATRTQAARKRATLLRAYLDGIEKGEQTRLAFIREARSAR